MRLNDMHLRRVLLSAVSGGVGSLFAALAPLITTPIMLAYLGDYRYGLWMMLLSITALIGLSDFGITNGITTELSVRGEGDAARRPLISNAYSILLLVAAALVLILLLVFLAMYSAASPGQGIILPLMMVAVLTPTIFAVPLGFVQRLLYIDLRGAEASLAPGIAALFSVAVAITGTWLKLNPYLLVFLFLLPVPLAFIVLTVRYFRRHPGLRPVLHDWDPVLARRIFRSGRMFVLLSLLVILCNRVDYMIVARFVGVVNLVPYSIADRVIGIANAAVTVLGASLWPVFANKTREGDIAWIKTSILRINLVIILFYSVLTVMLLCFYNRFLELWLGTAKETSPVVLVFLTLTSMAVALSAPYFALANSLGVIKEQMAAYLALLLIGLPLKCAAGLLFGTAGVAAGAFAGWALVMLPLIIFIVMRRLNGLPVREAAL
jgi:O-antigen/teichoic acid export membrane protein